MILEEGGGGGKGGGGGGGGYRTEEMRTSRPFWYGRLGSGGFWFARMTRSRRWAMFSWGILENKL